jgi:hypothetical protein
LHALKNDRFVSFTDYAAQPGVGRPAVAGQIRLFGIIRHSA